MRMGRKLGQRGPNKPTTLSTSTDVLLQDILSRIGSPSLTIFPQQLEYLLTQRISDGDCNSFVVGQDPSSEVLEFSG